MAVFATIAFAAFFLENDHFVTFYEGFFNLANHFCSFHGGSADFHGTVDIGEEDTVEFDSVAIFYGVDVVNIQVAALFGFELLPLNFYDNVHLNLIFK